MNKETFTPESGTRTYLALGSDVTKVVNLPLVYDPKATNDTYMIVTGYKIANTYSLVPLCGM